MKIKTSKFVKSLLTKLTPSSTPEIAMVGRSNVGKSSLINFLTNAKIAKTSSKPGKTRLINYFDINNGQFYLVDLPGYGFALTSKSESEQWGKMIEGYLAGNENLKNILFLLDIRHRPSADDRKMLSYMVFYNIPFTVVATKCDKLSRSQVNLNKQMLASELKIGKDNIYCVSSDKRTGDVELLARISQFVEGGED